jgi:hypothetical protein
VAATMLSKRPAGHQRVLNFFNMQHKKEESGGLKRPVLARKTSLAQFMNVYTCQCTG